MTERMNRLPPEVRGLIAEKINTLGPQGLVTTAVIMNAIRATYPDTVTDRELEDAIAEAAVAAGLAVDFNFPSERLSVKEKDAREGV